MDNYNNILNILSSLLLTYNRESYFTLYEEIISIIKNIKILYKMKLPIDINILYINDINNINDITYQLYEFKNNFKDNKYEFVNIYDKIYFIKINNKITSLNKLLLLSTPISTPISILNKSANVTTSFIIDYIYNCFDKLSTTSTTTSTNNSTNIKIISKQYIDDLYKSTNKLIQRDTIYNHCIFTNSSFLFQQYSEGSFYNLYFNL